LTGFYKGLTLNLYPLTMSKPFCFQCFHEFFGYPPGKARKRDLNNCEQSILTQLIEENKTKKTFLRKYILTLPGFLMIVLLLGMAGFLIYQKVFKPGSAYDLVSSDGRISI